jgi:hypothetical protein
MARLTLEPVFIRSTPAAGHLENEGYRELHPNRMPISERRPKPDPLQPTYRFRRERIIAGRFRTQHTDRALLVHCDAYLRNARAAGSIHASRKPGLIATETYPRPQPQGSDTWRVPAFHGLKFHFDASAGCHRNRMFSHLSGSISQGRERVADKICHCTIDAGDIRNGGMAGSIDMDLGRGPGVEALRRNCGRGDDGEQGS